MGIEKFEKIIKENKDFFEEDPSSEHMDKFFFKLQEKQNKNQLFKTSKNSNKAWWIGVAATLSLLVTIGWFISQQTIETRESQQMGLSAELLKIRSYYANESEKKIKKINECANQSETTKRLVESSETQIKKLSFNADKIEYKLKESAGNKRLEMAYVKSLKTKNDLLNKIYAEVCNRDNNLLTQ
jgi:hypothetical protein